jgi:hypothetical protein
MDVGFHSSTQPTNLFKQPLKVICWALFQELRLESLLELVDLEDWELLVVVPMNLLVDLRHQEWAVGYQEQLDREYKDLRFGRGCRGIQAVV